MKIILQQCQRPYWSLSDNIHCIHHAGHFFTEAYQVGQVWLFLGESYLTAPDDFLLFHMPGNARISCSITFPGIKVSLTGLYFLWSSFLLFLKIGVTFAFVQSLGTSPNNKAKIIESGLTITSASSLSTCGFISSGHMDFWMYSLCKYSLTRSFSSTGTSSLLQPLSLVSGTWDSWKPLLLVKTEAKKAFSTSAYTYTLGGQREKGMALAWAVSSG